jgi:hypothetical protein
MGDPQIQSGSKEVARELFAGQFIDAAAGTPEGEFVDADDDGDFGDIPVTDGVFDNREGKDEFAGGLTIIGTNDRYNTLASVDNIYMHELGHVLGGIHPSKEVDTEDAEFTVPEGTEGVMCKDSCIDVGFIFQPITSMLGEQKGESILRARQYSGPSKNRILSLDYDHRDKEDGDPEDGNEARNLTSVSTAASDK